MENKPTLTEEQKQYCLQQGITNEDEMIKFLQNDFATEIAQLKMDIKEILKKRELARQNRIKKKGDSNSQLDFGLK
jgi:hypothetical protein